MLSGICFKKNPRIGVEGGAFGVGPMWVHQRGLSTFFKKSLLGLPWWRSG